MNIPAKTVMELRKITNVGMMECKKALIEAEGDISVAKDLLLKSGAAKATKKVNREVNEGLLFIANSSDNLSSVIVEINCETDFVAKSDLFLDFGNKVASIALDKACQDANVLLTESFSDSATIEQERQAVIGKLGENIQISRCTSLRQDSGCVVSYSHGNKIVTLVSSPSDKIDIVYDIAMHIAAMRPSAITSSGISEDLVNKEKEIFAAQLENSGKSSEIVSKIIDGKVNKFLDDMSLYGQVFVKDSKKKVAQYLKENSVDISSFVFCEIGSDNNGNIISK